MIRGGYFAVVGIITVAVLLSPGTAAQTARSCDSPAYKQFDFWVGEWNVYIAGKLVGTNNVQKIVGDCVLLENWTSADGHEGKSLNTFNSRKRKWQQTWMDDRGSVIEFEGEAKEGVMVFHSEMPDKNGVKVQHRMTFTKMDKNRLRQLWEQSHDNGATWKVVFDGEYQRKP